MSARRKRFDAMQHPVASREDWETPDSIFSPLDAEFRFELDVCASQATAKSVYYFTEQCNGLARPWAPRVVWCNPPYGREIPQWVAKAREEATKGATVVMLIPSRTDTRWWHDHVQGRAEVRFVRGRIKFVGAPYNAPFPSAIVVFRQSDPS